MQEESYVKNFIGGTVIKYKALDDGLTVKLTNMELHTMIAHFAPLPLM